MLFPPLIRPIIPIFGMNEKADIPFNLKTGKNERKSKKLLMYSENIEIIF